jgi:hypothetical protein
VAPGREGRIPVAIVRTDGRARRQGGDTSQSDVDPNGPFSPRRPAMPMIAPAADAMVLVRPS